MTEPIRVAIIGGGCGGVATAFELTRPEHEGRFEVTIYQQGWRLGGKGASGRTAATGRIEEHGLHLWMGFYENAFAMMRECYEELGRDPEKCPMATWDQAFKPDNFVGVTERQGEGPWRDWTAYFPPASGQPGDPLKGADPFTIPGYLARCALLLRTLVTSVQDRLPQNGAQNGAKGGDDLIGAVAALVRATADGVAAAPAESLARALKYGQLAAGVLIVEALDLLRRLFEGRNPAAGQGAALGLLASVSDFLRRQVETLTMTDDEVRRVWEIADVVIAIMKGIIFDGLIFNPAGFDAIDDLDWREWLRKHGASDAALDSAFIRASYDLLFAYEEGDVERPALAAGQALRGALRMFFTYRGALFWKMQAGMGDVVFSPFYEVLKARGARFEFFHRLENIRLGDDGNGGPGHVAALEMSRQAKVRGGGEYQPLVVVKGVPSWPSQPDWTQLVNGARLRAGGFDPESRWEDRRAGERVLKVGEDFDHVVLAVGLGEVPAVSAELIARSRRWRRMVDEVGTVATQAFQLWLTEPVEALGWSLPPVNISGYVEPFDTWADMRQLIPVEDWQEEPGAIAYFCSVLPDAQIPATGDPREGAREAVRAGAVDFLENHVSHFWPEAAGDGGFRWELLAAEPGDRAAKFEGSARFETQFWTANINPTDRYVLSLPGSLRHRISPLEEILDNFTVAGDWTQCGHQAGCVEAAVMSGRLAAHALSCRPALEEIVGYDHP